MTSELDMTWQIRQGSLPRPTPENNVSCRHQHSEGIMKALAFDTIPTTSGDTPSCSIFCCINVACFWFLIFWFEIFQQAFVLFFCLSFSLHKNRRGYLRYTKCFTLPTRDTFQEEVWWGIDYSCSWKTLLASRLDTTACLCLLFLLSALLFSHGKGLEGWMRRSDTERVVNWYLCNWLGPLQLPVSHRLCRLYTRPIFARHQPFSFQHTVYADWQNLFY